MDEEPGNKNAVLNRCKKTAPNPPFSKKPKKVRVSGRFFLYPYLFISFAKYSSAVIGRKITK